MNYVLSRLREPSTYSAIAGVLAGMSFIPHVTDIAGSLPIIGSAVAGLLGIWLPEKAA